jgi:peptidyl-tRNA hydrolase, PTH2 family
MEDVKQIIVIRRDLKMRRGKEIAQGAHASNQFLIDNLCGSKDLTKVQVQWFNTGTKKVTVQVGTLAELEEVFQNAKNAGLITHKITDSGLTEFHGEPTITCIAIGPDFDNKIDPITGHLKLY